jgi:hypothetical protein
MQKLILHFREGEEEQGIFLILVKAIYVPTDLFEPMRDDLINKGFDIYARAHNSIEAKYSKTYLMALDILRALDKEGWQFKKMGRVKIDVPGHRKTLPE